MFCCRAETLPSHFRVEIVRCRWFSQSGSLYSMDRRLRNSHLAASGGLTRIDDWFFSKRTRHTLPTTLHTSPDTALSRLFQSALLSARLANCPLHFTASCKSTARPEDNLFRGGAREMRQMNLNAKFGKTPKIQANATVKLTLLPTWTLRLFSAFSARLRVKSARRHWRRRFSSVFPTFRRLFLCNANIPGGITSLAESATLFPWTSSRTFWRF